MPRGSITPGHLLALWEQGLGRAMPALCGLGRARAAGSHTPQMCASAFIMGLCPGPSEPAPAEPWEGKGGGPCTQRHLQLWEAVGSLETQGLLGRREAGPRTPPANASLWLVVHKEFQRQFKTLAVVKEGRDEDHEEEGGDLHSRSAYCIPGPAPCSLYSLPHLTSMRVHCHTYDAEG